jgi:hypothetical protein
VRKTQKKEKTAHPTDVRAPHLAGVRTLRRRARPLLAGVRAPTWQACAPLARVRAPLDVRAPHLAGVRAPRSRARPPPGRRARPTRTGVRAPHLAGVCALPRRRVRAPSTVRAPLLVGVRAPPHRRRARPNPQTCAPPSALACAPYPVGMCAPRRLACPLADVHAMPPQCVRPHHWWQNKIYKEGSLTSPLHHAWLCVLGLLCGLLA